MIFIQSLDEVLKKLYKIHKMCRFWAADKRVRSEVATADQPGNCGRVNLRLRSCGTRSADNQPGFCGAQRGRHRFDSAVVRNVGRPDAAIISRARKRPKFPP